MYERWKRFILCREKAFDRSKGKEVILIRASGILMHLSSVPSPYGIGTMGQSAREFVDFLKRAGQKYWQILPVGQTSYGDSPYQSFSSFAGNPYFIDLDMLAEEGLLLPEEYKMIDWGNNANTVDYGLLYQNRYPLLRLAVKRFLAGEHKEFMMFCDEQEQWLDDYALFMTIKGMNGGASWLDWKEEERKRNYVTMEEIRTTQKDEILFWKVLQFFFYEQWNALRAYANENGVSIIGDLPIYVALDSADIWANPQYFQLDEELRPVQVAGCPPDGFAEGGQLWGNPLFDWAALEEDNFSWCINRIGHSCRVYNVLRLDHFRGFESYYAIPYGDKDAKGGHWEKGPGDKLFLALQKQLGKQKIIAEDLGFLTEPVREMLKNSGFPGMKVFELGFDSRDGNGSEYLPHNFIRNCVAYTGTHDNDTIQGWFLTAPKDDVEYACAYFGIKDRRDGHWDMMKALWATVADLTIVQAQDLFGLGSESRMNRPSTFGNNWQWRALPGSFTEDLSTQLRNYMKLYAR